MSHLNQSGAVVNSSALSMKSPGPSIVGGATADLEAPKAVIVNNDNELSSIDWSDDEEDTNPSAAKLLEAERMRVARADWKRRMRQRKDKDKKRRRRAKADALRQGKPWPPPNYVWRPKKRGPRLHGHSVFFGRKRLARTALRAVSRAATADSRALRKKGDKQGAAWYARVSRRAVAERRAIVPDVRFRRLTRAARRRLGREAAWFVNFGRQGAIREAEAEARRLDDDAAKAAAKALDEQTDSDVEEDEVDCDVGEFFYGADASEGIRRARALAKVRAQVDEYRAEQEREKRELARLEATAIAPAKPKDAEAVAAAREAVERTPAPRRARPPERKRKSVTASAARKRQRKAEEDAALRRLQPIAARIAAEVPPAPPTRDPSFYKNAPDAEFLAWFGLRDTAPSPADQNALIPSR